MATKPTKQQFLAQGLALTRKKGGKASQDEIDERRRMVVKMRMQGKTFKHISEELGTNYHTVKKDFDSSKKHFLKRIKNFNQQYEIGKTLTVYEQIEQEAWAEFERAPKGSASREKFLNTVRSARNDHLKLLMDTGLVEKAAKRVSHEVRPATAVLKDWSKDDKLLVTLALIQARMQQQAKGGNGVLLPDGPKKMLDLPPDAVLPIPYESDEE